MQADGLSLDDKRTQLDASKHENDNIPDIVARWRNQEAEKDRPRTAQSFMVPKADVASQDYDLSTSRYRQTDHEQVTHESPKAILAELSRIEDEIQRGIQELNEVLS